MICGDNLEVIVFPDRPRERAGAPLAERGREDVLGALETGARKLVDGEQQVLRAGLREGGNAPVPRLPHLVESILRRQVHDVLILPCLSGG